MANLELSKKLTQLSSELENSEEQKVTSKRKKTPTQQTTTLPTDKNALQNLTIEQDKQTV